MTKPRVFIGSSVEGLHIAESIQAAMEFDVESTIWSQGVFGLSAGTLETLVRVVDEFDFAVLVLTPDDLVQKRGTTRNSPRDNVLFELGLFMGALGRDRTFIVHCRDTPIDLPTDLAGVTTATFPKRKDENLQAAVGPVCTSIKRAIRQATSNSSATTSAQADAQTSITSLREEILNQAALTRQILEAVTSGQKINVQGTSKSPQKRSHDLDFLCGCWRNTETDSLGWARFVENEIHFVYSFGGRRDAPTGYYFNFILIGQSLFGRFKWFDGSFEGYTYLKIISKDLLEGGWWNSDDKPEQAIMGINNLKGTNASQWIRQGDSITEPGWVGKYFRSVGSGSRVSVVRSEPKS